MLPEMCLVQCRPDLFDVACENLCYESLSVRDFARCQYCVPVACKAQGLVRDDNGLCYANADQWGVARHKETARTRAPSDRLARRDGPSEPGTARRVREGGRGRRSQSLRAREQKTPARSPDELSATQKCATAASQRGADAHPTDAIQSQVVTRVSLAATSNIIELKQPCTKRCLLFYGC